MTVMSTASTTLHAARKGPRPMTAQDLWSIPRLGAPAPLPDGSGCAVAVTTCDLEKNEAKIPVRPLIRTAPAGSNRNPARATNVSITASAGSNRISRRR